MGAAIFVGTYNNIHNKVAVKHLFPVFFRTWTFYFSKTEDLCRTYVGYILLRTQRDVYLFKLQI